MGAVDGGFGGSYRYSGAVTVTDDPGVTATVPDSGSDVALPVMKLYDPSVIVADGVPASADAGTNSAAAIATATANDIEIDFAVLMGFSI